MQPSLDHLSFDNSFLRELPGDPETENRTRQVFGASYSRVSPTPVQAPELVAFSPDLAARLDLTPEQCESTLFAEVFSGNQLLPGMDPSAACYGGHQFGNWAGQLGDGRAISLGELLTNAGERWELQLKGAGPTPYSRSADGRAVMRSSVREFLCSEAMAHLGVPTTRALSLVHTGDIVVRDMFYDGRPRPEPGAIVCRTAPSFIRFGNFQILAHRREHELLKRLMDHTLARHYPELGPPGKDTYLHLLEVVCKKTAEMIIGWMRVGFVHGVMNTDNMSILGQTIDYGPYGWMDNYDPDWTPNTTDAAGRRYRFAAQPQIALWNLQQFAAAILPLIESPAAVTHSLNAYTQVFEPANQAMVATKLGLKEVRPDDNALIEDLFKTLTVVETDMTIFFRKLATLKADGEVSSGGDEQGVPAPLLDAYYAPEAITKAEHDQINGWLKRYLLRVQEDGTPDKVRRKAMNAVNPNYVLRNYIAQLAIDKAETGDYSVVKELLSVLKTPYEENPDQKQWAQKRPEWARHRPGCSMLSCSS